MDNMTPLSSSESITSFVHFSHRRKFPHLQAIKKNKSIPLSRNKFLIIAVELAENVKEWEIKPGLYEGYRNRMKYLKKTRR
jgi:hypothetical protein